MSFVLEKAAELAAAIEESDELKQVKEMQKVIQEDKEAEEILNSFFQMQQQMYELQGKGIEPDDELNAQYNAIQDKMEQNMNVAKYYQSQAALGQLLQHINGLITKAITGEEGCSEESCASCAGCS